ncbi:MAG TPA: hypothetical protein VE131_04025, partial [Terriglobales bacterium]|nr:hypothetical protein [Terriglobales bacterium]
MDNLFIWMLISAGAVIGLLATFLLASERELKIKRRQLEIFADKLAGLTDTGSTREAVQNTDGSQIQ